MKNDNNKIYEKALKLYNNGYIDKAIELCEKGISNSLKDAKILNLKGLLLYIKGNLDEATALWKINKDYNNDPISRAYLEDSRNDFNRYLLYKDAQSLIENLYIDEALENLLECSKSDFNLIEVNNLMALSYMKKGQYDNSRLCLEKVLVIDRKNTVAKERLKEINGLLYINKKSGVLITGLSLIVILSLSILITYNLGIMNINLKGNEIKEIITFKTQDENNKRNEDNNKVEDNNLSENKQESELIENEIPSKEDKEEIVEDKKEEQVSNDKVEEVSTNEDFKQLTRAEIQSNYSEASYNFKIKEYDEAIKIFEATKKSSENSDLNDDILFFLAASYQGKKDDDKAIEAYKDFLSKYNKGNYVEEAFYKIILLYEDKDISSSKEYAKKFTENYPSSIYNNNKVQSILSK